MTTDEQQSAREARHDRNARMIREYWAARGHVVEVTVKRASFGRYIVSDLVNGLPRAWRGEPKLAEQTYAAPEPRERPCLRCGTRFLSAHFGNRLCDPCRRADVAMVEAGDVGGPVRRK